MAAILLVSAALLAAPAEALTTSVPGGSGIVAVGVHPPKDGSGEPIVEHMPLANLINFEVHFKTTTMAVTFDEGWVDYLDGDGNPVLPSATITQQMFVDEARLAGPAIDAGSRVILFFPLEELPFNVVPETIDVYLCFQEFAGPGGECSDPLAFVGIDVSEFHARPLPTYVYPFEDPTRVAGGRWFTAHGHELDQGHRRGGLRRSGDQVWVNQRYAYDFGVIDGGVDRNCTDDPCPNEDWYAWDEPLVAIGDGIVAGLVKGVADNEYAGATPPNLCDENGEPAGCQNFCGCGQIDISVDPPAGNCIYGSGNTVVIDHGNGEYSWYAHMKEGSNGHLSLGDPVSRGQEVGRVGNTGASGGPHLHFALMNGPDPECDDNVPFYASNVAFVSPGHVVPRRQLDVSLATPTTLSDIFSAPAPLPSNPVLPAGPVAEVEPNDTLTTHTALSVPTTVTAMLESPPVGDLAVRGDGVEDVFRVDLGGPDALRFDLDGSPSPENLDVYVLTSELGVLNPTHQGTSPGSVERVCLELDPGAYYVMVTNADQAPGGDVPYELAITSDVQTIAVEIEGGVAGLQVDADCEAVVDFTVTIHDNCCLEPDELDLQVTPTVVTGNATVGAVTLDPPQVVSGTDVVVTGRVTVSDLESCPAVLQIDAAAADCEGNVVDSAATATGDTIEVDDPVPPVVTASTNLSTLWPANNSLVDVGFQTSVSDNCDAEVAASATTRVYSDEPEAGGSSHAPDAADLDAALRLRAEREGAGDGRVYLLVTSATDACGNAAAACTVVGVPHDQSAAAADWLTQQAATAQQYCETNQGSPPPAFTLQGQSGPSGPKQ